MSNIRIGHMTLGIYQTNCYFVYRENSDKVLVFDPADHGEKIEAALGQHGLHTAAILLNWIWMASGSKFWQRPDIPRAVSAIISQREGS